MKNRIKLINCNEKIINAILESNDALSQILDVHVPNPWNAFGTGVFKYVLQKIKDNPDDIEWYSYLPIDTESKVLIGSCGFKGKPDENGIVDLGYEVAKDYRNRGYATEITQLLLQKAFKHEAIKIVQAHTLAEKNASVRVLEKCGFLFVNELNDDEDGLIWKWEKRRVQF